MKEKVTVYLPLQYFAEGGDGAAAAEGTNVPASGTEPPASPSFDDMLKSNKELKAEYDRRKAEDEAAAVQKAKAEWEAETKAKEEEAAKLAKMNADEKAKHEREKQDKALADREAAVSKRELMAEAKEQLTEKGLPSELAACLDYTSADTCKTSMEAVEKAFNSAVEAKVNDKLRGEAPKIGNENTAVDPFLEGLGIK